MRKATTIEAGAQAPALDVDKMNRKQKRDLFRQVADRKTRKSVFGKWRTRTEWKWEGK